MNDGSVVIPLTQGYVARVSPEDFERVNQFKWCVSRSNRGKLYAKRGVSVNGKNRTIRMHRFLMDVPDGVEVDHLDLDGLNNTRGNMRLASHGQNIANESKRVQNQSGYKGVYAIGGGWGAQVGTSYLGTFNTAEVAAQACDTEARRRYGAFARVNFPDDTTLVESRKGGVRRVNTSGFAGVSLYRGRKWSARLTVQGKRVHLGLFETAEQAAQAIAERRQELERNRVQG